MLRVSVRMTLLRRSRVRRRRRNFQGSQAWGVAPPETMKMQLQILPLPLRDAQGQRQDDTSEEKPSAEASTEFSGQSGMGRCSTRNYENAAADPSASPSRCSGSASG